MLHGSRHAGPVLRHVSLTHVFDYLKEVSLDIKLGGFASCVSQEGGRTSLGFIQRVVIATLGAVGAAISLCLEQLICEDTIPPAAVVRMYYSGFPGD